MKNIGKLKILLEMCVAKGLSFDLSPEVYMVIVSDYEKPHQFWFNSYYDGSLEEFDLSETIILEELLQRVEQYKSLVS